MRPRPIGARAEARRRALGLRARSRRVSARRRGLASSPRAASFSRRCLPRVAAVRAVASCHAMQWRAKLGEAGAPLGSVAADGLGEPDAGLLQRVVRRRRPGDRSARPAVRAAVGGRRSSRRKASSSPAWAAAIRRPRSRPSARALAAAIGRARRARGPRRPLLQRVVPSLTPGAPSCTRIGKRKAHHLPRR